MFSVVEKPGRTYWAASDGSSTYYKGQLVSFVAASKANTNGTVVPLAVAAGAADLTNYQVIAGVVIGFGRRTPQYTTLGSLTVEYEAGVVTQAAQIAREFTGAEGMYVKADPQVLIQIQEILPETVIRGPIFNAAYGTLVGVSTLTAVGASPADGMVTAATANAADAASILNMGTIYCRSGANRGIYRVNKNTSSTAPSVTTAFPYDEVVGDTFVVVPLKQGHSTVVIAGPGMYISSGSAPVAAGTDRFDIFVYKLNLEVAGSEYAEFRFGADHFSTFRA